MSEHEQLSFSTGSETNDEPVVCLGLTFKSDDERREYFREELRKKLPELKQIEGFPIGEDEDIIALSDPPYYTACPNPWINDFILDWESKKSINELRINKGDYHRTPFSSDISEGKNDPIYNAHSYHTKVPYKAIMRYLLHYTEPGDIVFDGFCGSGMTGVAAQMCGDRSTLQELNIPLEGNLGARKTILQDLSPAATFLSHSYNRSVNPIIAKNIYGNFISKLKHKYEWMFVTLIDSTLSTEYKEVLEKGDSEKIINFISNNASSFGFINHVVWSEVYTCPTCLNDASYNSFVSQKDNTIAKKPVCPHCSAENKKSDLSKVYESYYDFVSSKILNKPKLEMIKINYKYNNKRFEKQAELTDKLLYEISQTVSFDNINFSTVPFSQGAETNRLIKEGIQFGYQLYSPRNLLVLNNLLSDNISQNHSSEAQFLLGSTIPKLTNLNRYMPQHGSRALVGPMANALYLPPLFVENNSIKQLEYQSKKLIKAHNEYFGNIISNQSSTVSQIRCNSVDYIFVDPPFGSNIFYSELSFPREAWLSIFTNNHSEAIENKIQKKTINEYSELMALAFKEAYRILKPGKWITVEFSNTQASIWNVLQHVLQSAGFVIAGVDALDKKRGGFHAMISTTAVKQDLVISAYKPSEETINNIKTSINTPNSAWEFINHHLTNLPIFMALENQSQNIIERNPRILFDRMVAYHVQHGLPVPISSADFQNELNYRYVTRDGMIFLESQAVQYDKKRILAKDFSQMSLLVSDENSAIEWLRQQLITKPQTRQDLHTQFMKEIQHIAKHEKLPELDDLLAQNFLRYDNEPEVPSQIVSYFRRNYPDLRGLEPTDEKIKQKAINRWYVPDPNKQADLEKLREKSLLREFNLYVDEMTKSKKKLKEFRTEAIRAGFKKAWSEKDYQTIVDIGNRLPETVIQEDDKLLMYFDNAQIKLGL